MRCRNLKSLYGVNRRYFDIIRIQQGDKCKVCFDPLGNNQKLICLDHCHKSDRIRGILHTTCNLAVGCVENREIRRSSVASYLSKGRISLPPKEGNKFKHEIDGENRKCISCGVFQNHSKFQYSKKDNSRRKICNQCRVHKGMRSLDNNQVLYLKSLRKGCWICSDETEKLVFDHNYECCSSRKSCVECIRGLLCKDCNTFLGYCREKIDIINMVFDYLELR